MEKSWPAFIFLVLAAAPAALQASVFAAFGDEEEDDQPFMWMNEPGKELSVDISPINRAIRKQLSRVLGTNFKPGYGVTGRRRAYVKWGKSGYEILNWYKNPFKAFLGKTSLTVKAFWEQMTGTNTAGWDMPWTKDKVDAPLGGLFAVDGEFYESRLGYIAQKFIPMSILNLIDQDRLAAFFAPVGLGTSSFAAERDIAKVLEAYGDEGFRYALKGSPKKLKRLETMVKGILDAAWLNGYDPKKVMRQAKTMVRTKQNAEFFAILEKRPKDPNLAKLEEVARAARRTDGQYKHIINAVENRYERLNQKMTPRQRQAMSKAWQNARLRE